MQQLWCWRRQFETEVYVNPTIAISDEATKKGQSAVVTNLRGTAACGLMAEECLVLRFLGSNVLQHGEGKKCGKDKKTGKVLAEHMCRMLASRENDHTYICCVDGTGSNTGKFNGQGVHWRKLVGSCLRSLSDCNLHSGMNGIKAGAKIAAEHYDRGREPVSSPEMVSGSDSDSDEGDDTDGSDEGDEEGEETVDDEEAADDDDNAEAGKVKRLISMPRTSPIYCLLYRRKRRRRRGGVQ
jgi:hypothetical protein